MVIMFAFLNILHRMTMAFVFLRIAQMGKHIPRESFPYVGSDPAEIEDNWINHKLTGLVKTQRS